MRNKYYRDVAQFGRAPRSGRGGRGFESRHPDHKKNTNRCFFLFTYSFWAKRFFSFFVSIKCRVAMMG